MKIEGAIFDLDGTLLDSMFIWDTIGEDYLKSRGITPKENLNNTFKAMSLLQAAEYYQSVYSLSETTEEIMKSVNSMIEHLYANTVIVKDGVREFLSRLKQNNIKVCVATATDRYLVEAALKRNGISEYFSQIFTCTSVGFGKDNPAIYLKALEHLQTKKENTIIFEDALYAVKTAKRAGFKVIGVYDKSEAINQKEVKETVDFYINSFFEMRDFLD